MLTHTLLWLVVIVLAALDLACAWAGGEAGSGFAGSGDGHFVGGAFLVALAIAIARIA